MDVINKQSYIWKVAPIRTDADLASNGLKAPIILSVEANAEIGPSFILPNIPKPAKLFFVIEY